MYTNPSNIIDAIINLLEINSVQINRTIEVYLPSKSLSVFKGMRNTLASDFYPSLELDVGNVSNRWATTRSQRPRYSIRGVLTTMTSNQQLHLEFISTLMTLIGSILTSPENLQMLVPNESRWDPNGGLVATYITDSLIEDTSFNSPGDGTIRTAEFNWFALIHEPYADFKFRVGESDQPTILRPMVIE